MHVQGPVLGKVINQAGHLVDKIWQPGRQPGISTRLMTSDNWWATRGIYPALIPATRLATLAGYYSVHHLIWQPDRLPGRSTQFPPQLPSWNTL
jgi:hypothetical protein